MKRTLIILLSSIALYSCNSSPSRTKAIPGGGSEHLYELMDEDSTDIAADTTMADTAR